MILYNTTFHIDSAIDREFTDWLKSRFIADALSFGFVKPMVTRLINQVEPGCNSYALHLNANDISTVEKWEADSKMKLMQEMFGVWGERALAFSTPMEIVEL